MSDITWQRALDIAYRSMNRHTLDQTIFLAIVSGDATVPEVEEELKVIHLRSHPRVRAYWMAPCDCGRNHPHPEAILN